MYIETISAWIPSEAGVFPVQEGFSGSRTDRVKILTICVSRTDLPPNFSASSSYRLLPVPVPLLRSPSGIQSKMAQGMLSCLQGWISKLGKNRDPWF